MRNELTNLLPIDRQRALYREYLVRLGVVSLSLVIVLTFIAAVLLIPTYLFLASIAHTKEARLASIESTLSSSEEEDLSVQIETLSENATTLSTLSNGVSASGLMRSLLTIARAGVTLSGFIYTPAVDKNAGTLKVSGIAETRSALRAYQLALSSAPFARAADLPVSAYAMDNNIAFTITVTLIPPGTTPAP